MWQRKEARKITRDSVLKGGVVVIYDPDTVVGQDEGGNDLHPEQEFRHGYDGEVSAAKFRAHVKRETVAMLAHLNASDDEVVTDEFD